MKYPFPYESHRESFISKINPSPSELDLGMWCLTLKKTECSGGQRQRNTVSTPCGQRYRKMWNWRLCAGLQWSSPLRRSVCGHTLRVLEELHVIMRGVSECARRKVVWSAEGVMGLLIIHASFTEHCNDLLGSSCLPIVAELLQLLLNRRTKLTSLAYNHRDL